MLNDWNPESYARFGDLRFRPALDLLARVGALPAGDVVDLGCGTGTAGPALRGRFGQGRRLIGLDASPAMLAAAEAAGGHDLLVEGDAAAWTADTPVALIFSNAALQWVGDHARLMPRLAAQLAPGGVLAVQMPRQHGAPSHRFLRDFAAEMFPDRFDAAWVAPVAAPVEYHRMLAPLGRADVWETDYVQRLDPLPAGGHPVRSFTEATAMRPFLDRLTAEEAGRFVARYEAALPSAYPVEADGSVLFPFRRLFFVLTV